jgi:hypothetical protein
MDDGRISVLPRYRIERRLDGELPVVLVFADDLRQAKHLLERIQRIGRRGPYRGDLVIVDQVTETVVASLPTGRPSDTPSS